MRYSIIVKILFLLIYEEIYGVEMNFDLFVVYIYFICIFKEVGCFLVEIEVVFVRMYKYFYIYIVIC